MMPGRPSVESRLLSKDENSLLFSLLGVKCQSLASCVVQLFLTEPPHHSQWKKHDAGIMCLVKDHTKRSYFFRLYCLSRKILLWENELYNSLEYTAPRIWLHTFEAESCMAAFNFADEDEAKLFQNEVQRTLANKSQKQIERRARNSRQMEGYQGRTNNLQYSYKHNGPDRSRPQFTGNETKGKDQKRKLRKEDIGEPQDFRHVSHVGWDANRGFEGHGEALENPQLQEILFKAGVSDNQLRDPDTRNFIYGFLEKHGGIPTVKNEVTKLPKAPPVPSRAPPPAYSTSKPLPSPPPSSLHSKRQVPTPVSSNQRVAPPPPPPPPTSSLPKLPESEKSKNAPPPPPPPPPPPLLVDPVPPRPNAPSPPVNPRAALMEAIKSGHTLKHVDPEKKSISHLDSREELMDQIRHGVELKSVQHIEKSNGPSVPLDGIAGALARALAERSKAFHNDSDSDTESEEAGDSDSEWDE